MQKRRKLLWLLLLAAGLLLLSACQKDAIPQEEPDPIPFAFHDWDRIDGSTATIPLTNAMAMALGGVSEQEAQALLTHNKTHNAYVNLIEGQADLIFVTAPSEEVLALAERSGVALDIIPVVKDAFVFLVNVQNPVDDLRLAALRDIYSGNVRNWKQVGGPDQNIIAYQRPDTSGSQALFYQHILGRDAVMERPDDWVIGDMGGLVHVILDYDNSPQAIGYSVYYYVSSMYGREDEFKLLGVDGVKPTPETILSGDYPLTDAYYAVLRRDTPQDASVRALVDWLLSEDGQTVAMNAGYVADAEAPYPYDLTHRSSGTGGTKWLGPWREEMEEAKSLRLSDLFYDGVNYIDYINREIAQICTLDTAGEPVSLKRPYSGIPNDYADFSLSCTWDWDGAVWLTIEFPEGGLFFEDSHQITILLHEDISPYGGPEPFRHDDYTPTGAYDYHFDYEALYDYSDVKIIVTEAADFGNEDALNRLIDRWYAENLPRRSDFGPNIRRVGEFLFAEFSLSEWSGWDEDKTIGFVLDMRQAVLTDYAAFAQGLTLPENWWELESIRFDHDGLPEDYQPGEGTLCDKQGLFDHGGLYFAVSDPVWGDFTMRLSPDDLMPSNGYPDWKSWQSETLATYNLN